MKKIIIALIAAVGLSTSAFALNLDLGISQQGAWGYGSVGVSDAQWGASLGFNTSDREFGTTKKKNTTIVLQGNGVYALDNNVDMLYGVQYKTVSGDYNAAVTPDETDSNATIGLFVGLRTALTDSLSVEANYFPYSVETKKSKVAGADEDKTTKIGGEVQLRATYSLPM